ncbi:MAG: hypothetical protein HGA45_13080 [Chloroflexales bacterium]|nr:hypothetical protein [Chloroflexales bacterium]
MPTLFSPLSFAGQPPAPPRPALSGRDAGLGQREEPPASIGPDQLARFKEEIVRDLIDRIRTDFERGA